MALASSRRQHTYVQLDAKKLKRAQKVLAAETGKETVERALDLVIAEAERNKVAAEANRHFLKSGIAIRDVFGELRV